MQKDRDNDLFSSEKTVFEEPQDEPLQSNEIQEAVEPTRIHSGDINQFKVSSGPSHTSADQEPNDKEFEWEAPSNPGQRISPKSYYADESIFGKLFNVFSLIMLGFGLLIGAWSGYMVRGFFISVEPSETVQYMPPPATTEPPTTAPATTETHAEETTAAATETTADTTDSTGSEESAAAEAPAESAPVVAAPVAKAAPKAAVKPPPKKAVVAKKTLKAVKLSGAANQANVDLLTSSNDFKYTARLVSGKTHRLLVDLNGLAGFAAKGHTTAPASAKPVGGVSVAKKDADSVRVTIEFKGKKTPRYTINRNKSGLRIVVRK